MREPFSSFSDPTVSGRRMNASNHPEVQLNFSQCVDLVRYFCPAPPPWPTGWQFHPYAPARSCRRGSGLICTSGKTPILVALPRRYKDRLKNDGTKSKILKHHLDDAFERVKPAFSETLVNQGFPLMTKNKFSGQSRERNREKRENFSCTSALTVRVRI